MADIVGLAVAGRVVRGVEVSIRRGGRHTVLRTGERSIPEATFDGGRLQDPLAFATVLEELWAQAGFKSKRVRLAIDGRLAVIRRTELPSIHADKLRQAAGYDIGELLNYPITEALFDVDEIEQFERDGALWARTLVVAVEASALSELKSAVSQAGLRLCATDLTAEALARSIRVDPDSTGETESGGAPMAIVDCEDTVTNVVIRDASGVLFARTLNVGVGETTISVADELESALAQLSGDNSDISTDPQNSAVGVSNVVEGIRRTLSYYSTELDPRPIAEVAVLGGRGNAAGLVASLENTLALPSSAAPSAAAWPDDDSSSGFELPLGAALGSAPSNTRHLVLTSDREREARAKRRLRAASIAVSIPVAALLFAATPGLMNATSEARAETERAETTAATLALRVADLQGASGRVADWESAAADVTSIEEQQLRLDLVVAELAESMPGDVRLVSIQLTGVAGDAPTGYTGPTPAGLVSISGVADDLDGVGRWLAEANATATIDGLWLDQSTFGPIGADGANGAIFSVEGVITAGARPLDSLISADVETVDGDRGEGR